jgi:hypothetical protein
VIELLRRCCAAAATARRTPAPALAPLILALLLSGLTAAAGAASLASPIGRYSAGEGITLPWGLWLAGDLTVGGEVPEHGPAAAEIDDVRLLARWEPTPRLSLFTELRLEDTLEIVEAEGVNTGDVEFLAERLYAEVLLTPTVTLRLGKVFTPFGLWNVIDRAPFTWTIEEPAIVEDVFPTRATGLTLLHRTTWHGWTLDATAYGPAQDAFRFQRSEGVGDAEGWLAGGRVAAGRAIGGAFASLGLNGAGFRDFERGPWNTATGLDLDLSAAGHELTGELTFSIPGGGGRTVYGLYLQDAVPLEPLGPLARNLYAVLRFEHLQPARGGSAVGGLGGVFWRPHPRLVLRADYLFGNRNIDNFEPGFHGSISLLF